MVTTAPDHVNIFAGLDWLDVYPGHYEFQSRKNREKRQKARERARQRYREAGAPLSVEQADFRDFAIRISRSRREAVEARWRYGHVWGGGPVGGNNAYYRPYQIYQGLVSAEHPLLMLFAAKTHRARRLLTGATKAAVGTGDSKLLALDEAYVMGNPMMRGFLRVDLDAIFPSAEAVFDACDRAGVTRPNVVVGHRRPDGTILRPHLLWLLERSVTFCGRGLPGPRALWGRVLRGLTYALIPSGADVGALSNPMRTKNPLCPVWSRWIGEERPYSLEVLKVGLPLTVTKEEMAVAAAAHPRQPVVDVVADPGAGSNAVFIALKDYVATHVAARVAAGGSLEEWQAELTLHAYEVASRCASSDRRARACALRVAEHSWNRAGRAPLSKDEVARRRQQAGRDSARQVGADHEAKVIAAYLALRQANPGRWPTQAEVVAATGASQSTVAKYWRVARAAALADTPTPKTDA